MGIAAAIGCLGAAVHAREGRMSDQTTVPVRVSLEVQVKQGEPVVADLRFANEGGKPYRLLSWLTFPTGRIDSKNYFKVTVDGQPARYTGMMKKRKPPTEADYLVIAVGEAVSRTVSLGEAYALQGPGLLSVTYDAINPGLSPGAPGDRLTSNTVAVQLD
jgi:hypothetical protein